MIAVVLSLAAAVTPSAAAAPVPGGPVILDGNDPADHITAASQYMQDVYANLNSNLAPGYVHNSQVAVIGSCSSDLTTMGVTETLVAFNTALAIEGLFVNIGANNYKHLHICSDQDSTLSLTVETELDKWGSAIAAHVNRGGGLFSTGHSYNWLSDLFPSLTVNNGGSSTSYVTADGATFFASLSENNQLNAVNHYTFADVGTTTLLPLLSEFSGGTGRVIAIGGTTVRFPQISFVGPATGEVGTEGVFTLVAADADGNALSSNAFTWTISGPTTAAGTGSDVTDLNGEFEFRFSGSSKGQTRVTVQMTLGTGESAGSAITTTWATIPAAPPITSAVDIAGQDSSVLISWNTADDGGKPVTDYVIQYMPSGGSWTTFADGISTTTSATVNGLTNDIAYDFRVAAVNPVGQSPWSATATGTPAGSPPAPTWVGFVAGDTQFAVDWTAPASDNGSAITHYIVEYSLQDAATWTTLSPNPTVTDVTIIGVTNAVWYDVRVAAVNANGQGAWSDLLVATALTVPGAVVDLRLVPGDGELRLEWASPEFDGGAIVSGFTIGGPGANTCVPDHWHPVGAHDTHWWSCSIGGLTNGVDVTFSVAANNSQGTGQATNVAASPEATPPPPSPPAPTPAPISGGIPNPATQVCSAPNPNGPALTEPFSDVTHPYQIGPIEQARAIGLIRGVGDGLFDPDGLVPRTDLARLLWQTFDRPAESDPHGFVDVGVFPALDWAHASGFILGVGADRFDPARPATRAEWITILWRATCEPVIGTPNPFVDLTAAWQQEPVHWGASTGVTFGRSATRFHPDEAITRGEAVVMLIRWINSFEQT